VRPEEQSISDIKHFIETHQRFREASLRSHFDQELQDYIDAYPSDESFKIKLFRRAGHGCCKTCGKPTAHVEKIRFYVYCSKECETGLKRDNRMEEYLEELKGYGLTTSMTSFTDVDQVATYTCKHGHTFTNTVKYVRYVVGGCPTCRGDKRFLTDEERERRIMMAPIIKAQNHELAVQRREETKLALREERASKVGDPSGVMCKCCGKETALTIMSDGLRLYAPKFCSPECDHNWRVNLKEDTVESLKKLLNPNLHEYVRPAYPDKCFQDQPHIIRFVGCGHEYSVILRNLVRSPAGVYETPTCPECNRASSSSLVANRVIDALKARGHEVKVNDRKQLDGLEIDIWLPEHQMGIEVNGIYWHSAQFKEDKNYHLNKTKLAREKGIKLLHFYDDEINRKFDIIMSIIDQKLGVTKRSIFGRKCDVRRISSMLANDFLEVSHLQGKTNAAHHVGLFYLDELVSVMSFRKPFLNRSAEWEIARFASKPSVSVVGGGSKLLAHFREEFPGSIMSYSDERYTTGRVYEKMGFTLKNVTEPGYSYSGHGVRKHRLQLTKKKLVEEYNGDPDLTEEELATERGWYRIYDCGQKVWVMD
jgi:very-short-patch-repair endonuclease